MLILLQIEIISTYLFCYGAPSIGLPYIYLFGLSAIWFKKLFMLMYKLICREIMQRYRAPSESNEDIHAKMMRRYKDIPSWWFHSLLVVTLVVSLALCIFRNDQVQMPWWGLLLAGALALGFTLPVSIITATTNHQVKLCSVCSLLNDRTCMHQLYLKHKLNFQT